MPTPTDTSSSWSPSTMEELKYANGKSKQIDMGEELTEENLVQKHIVSRPFAKYILGLLLSLFIGTFQDLYDWAKSKSEETIAAKQGKGSYAGQEIGKGPAANIKTFVEAYNRGQTRKSE